MPVVDVDGGTQLLYAGSDPFLLVNNDTANSIYVSQQPGVNGADDALPPQASVGLSGPWYVSTLDQGKVVQAVVFPGATQWDNPVGVQIALAELGLATAANQETTQTTLITGIALPTGAAEETGNLKTAAGLLAGTTAGALIANTGKTVGQEMAALLATGSATGTAGGVPLLNGNGLLGSAAAVSLPDTGAFITEGPFTVTQPGYELWISLAYAISAPSGEPTSCTLIWRDAATSDHIETEQFDLFPGASTGNAHIMTFKGPSKSSQVLVQFSNADTLSAVTMSYQLWQNSRVLPRSIGKTIQVPTMFAGSTYFPAFGNPSRNIIASYNDASLAAATTVFVIASVYNGDVMLNLSSGVGVNPPLSIQAWPVDSVSSGAPIYSNYQLGIEGIQDVLAMPRAELVFEIVNHDASGAHAVNFTLVAKEEGT